MSLVPNCSQGQCGPWQLPNSKLLDLISEGVRRTVQKWQKVAKVIPRGSKGKCYQMWQKVAKGVPKVVQGRPTLFAKAHGLERLPAVLARRASAAGAP